MYSSYVGFLLVFRIVRGGGAAKLRFMTQVVDLNLELFDDGSLSIDNLHKAVPLGLLLAPLCDGVGE